MPRFRFQKLVRDMLPASYASLDQKIVARRLTGKELLSAMRVKLIEEAAEIPFEDGSREDLTNEISDIQQVLDDMKAACGLSDEEVARAQETKFKKKGGFAEGIFVETIELNDGDEWVGYYRKDPKKYPEE